MSVHPVQWLFNILPIVWKRVFDRTVVADSESVAIPPETMSVNAAAKETVPLSAMCSNLPPVRSEMFTSLWSAELLSATLVTTTPASIHCCITLSISLLSCPSDNRITSACSVESSISNLLIV